MKRYFFDLSNGGWEPDAIGTELPDDAAARCAAVQFTGEILRHEPQRLGHGPIRVNVHNRDQTVRFSLAVVLVTD